MESDLLGLAFTAGLVAALNPCGFAMLPAYLTFVVQGERQRRRPAAIGRAVVATFAMTMGFLAVFVTFGLLAVSLASTVQRYLPAATVAIGVVLVGLGVWLLLGRQLRLPSAGRFADGRWAPTLRPLSMFGYGISYAVASLSCTIAPFLAITGVGLRGGGLAVYLAYAAGFALVVGTLAVAAVFASSALTTRARRALPVINRIGGVIVIVVGLYVAYYGSYELRLFHFGGDPDDALVAAAGSVQAALAGWVQVHGGWPWMVALAALVMAACVPTLVWAWRKRAGYAAGKSQCPDEGIDN